MNAARLHISRIDMIEPDGGGGDETQRRIRQQSRVAPGPGPGDQGIGAAQHLRRNLSARPVIDGHAVSFQYAPEKRYFVVGNDFHEIHLLLNWLRPAELRNSGHAFERLASGHSDGHAERGGRGRNLDHRGGKHVVKTLHAAHNGHGVAELGADGAVEVSAPQQSPAARNHQ
ncbi:hypothetical protein SDC9_129749 [bioreactor metagenome]|uniref:Uncharacterized protein n=1 Tax=bioreactor metagenome TaxID=1076179 RepID=A0A645D0I6_9ZZZZ